MPHAEVVECVRRDRIDILVDLSGHTTPHRLLVFASKPAPVQATYLGYCNTTGLSSMDWRITDDVCDPPGQTERFCSEQLARIAGGFSCYMPSPTAPPVALSPALRREFVTFGSTHKLLKLNDEVVATWAALLTRVPASRLLIFRHNLTQDDANRLAGRFAALGIGVDRLEIRGGMPAGGHLHVYADIDILLDAWPWSGHTTVCEALWMGSAVVTLAGDRPAARLSASALRSAGLHDWVARDRDEYLNIAAGMASNVPALGERRPALRHQLAASRLCDATTHTRQIEFEYRRMWRAWCQSPRGAAAG
jgi:predicted O-linked N-acetylglucosamine transferase (SPINDLY family)